MKTFKFKAVRLNEEWIEDALVSIDKKGIITRISTDHGLEEVELVNGYAMPGFQNAHSHAFQYAMAGTAENHVSGAPTDDFWSWRETMYKLALNMEPQDIEHIAAMAYSEMVRHGYTHVAEFHYLHHDKNGKPYDNLAEHGERLIAAAKHAGIKITLMPIFYQKGGFGVDPQPRQRRFISPTTEAYLKLLEASQKVVDLYEDATLGFGIHSLRAVQGDDFLSAINDGPKAIPFHVHIAEQLREIEEAQAYFNLRPVQWLLENVEVTNRFHLIHATHLIQEEVEGIAGSGAHVVLCPSTEGNLGDGIFPLKAFQKHGGHWSIGTDSHVGLNPLEELRLLDYGQRLTSHQRNTFLTKEEPDSGANGYKQALLSGRKAMGNNVDEYLKPGQPLDIVVYDANVPLLASSSLKNLLSTIIYSSDASQIVGTMTNGEWKAKNNRHLDAQRIADDFISTIKALKIR